MVKNLGVDGIYIDDSALDRKTLQRARRILDADGKRRLIDIHSWNHMNQWAGYANSLHLYTELLPYIDRTWIGEGFKADNSVDFWLVEMSGIPFGLLSETLDAILFGVWYLECFPVYPGAVILSHSGNCGIRSEWIKQPCMAIGMKTTLLKRTMQISLQPFIRMKIKLFS